LRLVRSNERFTGSEKEKQSEAEAGAPCQQRNVGGKLAANFQPGKTKRAAETNKKTTPTLSSRRKIFHATKLIDDPSARGRTRERICRTENWLGGELRIQGTAGF
jgi:hypothetical protein